MKNTSFIAALSLTALLSFGSAQARTLDETLGLDESKPHQQVRTGDLLLKDPMIAGLMSAAVPGLGQVYAGRRMRGLMFFVGTVGALGATAAFAEPANLELSDYDRVEYDGNGDGLMNAQEIVNWEDDGFQDDAFENLSAGRKAGAITSGVIGLGLYVWNIFDARNAANAHNERAVARRFELGLLQRSDHTGLALNINF